MMIMGSTDHDSKAEEMVKLSDVSCNLGKECVLKDIDLSVSKGMIQVIIGPSGAGKTSLLKLMNGILEPRKGDVSVMGCDCARSRFPNSKRFIGYIPQHLGLIESMTVEENVLMGSLSRASTLKSMFKVFPEKERHSAEKLMSLTGIRRKSNKKVRELSGGEKRRVAIARAFMQKPRLLLADEILSDLDFVLVKQMTEQIKKLRDEFSTTIVMVEHDMNVARSIGDRILILREGSITGIFSPDQVTDELLSKHFSGGHD